MKLKITQKGFENYTGQMGMVLFQNGISVKDVDERAALRLAAGISMTWEDGSQVKYTVKKVEPTAPIGRETHLVATDGLPEEVRGNDGKTIYVEPEIDRSLLKITRRYTREELEDIADQSGLKGIREIAGPLGIKGTSINALIDKVMEIAGKREELPEGVEVVGD